MVDNGKDASDPIPSSQGSPPVGKSFRVRWRASDEVRRTKAMLPANRRQRGLPKRPIRILLDQLMAAKEKYFYFVDGTKYETDESHLTGAAVKAQLPEAKRGYLLYLEGQGKHPDQLINDDTSVSLVDENGHKRFFTVPPASFGCR